MKTTNPYSKKTNPYSKKPLNRIVNVSKECFKIKKYPEGCLHYAQTNPEDTYDLLYDWEIIEHLIESSPDVEHFKNAKNKKPVKVCTPWVLMNDEEKETILLNKYRKPDLLFEKRYGSTTVLFNQNVEADIVKSDILNYLEADCNGAYIKDSNGFQLRVLFKRDEKDEETRFNNTIQNIDKILDDCTAHNNVLCIVMGHRNFIDVHYYPNPDSTFNRIEVTYLVH
jgi:hypothetical protein